MIQQQMVIIRKGQTEKRISEYAWNKSGKDKDGRLDGWEFVKYVFINQHNKVVEGKIPTSGAKAAYIPQEVQDMKPNPSITDGGQSVTNPNETGTNPPPSATIPDPNGVNGVPSPVVAGPAPKSVITPPKWR